MSLREHHTQTTTTTSASQSHLYPQALQLKLYQAFIFSIPILFSIILFLLFYLFYLKRRASNLQSSPPILIRTRNLNLANSASPSQYVSSSSCAMDFKGELNDKLHIILLDDELRKKDSQCCVCLGEFEMEEELLQVQSCKHVFHVECIHHWLHNNTTCPLCRCSVIPISMSSKIDTSTNPTLATASTEPPPPAQHHHSIVVSHHSPGIVSLHLRQQQQQDSNVSAAPNVTAAAIGELEASSNPPTAAARSGGSALTESGGCSSNSDRDLGDSVTIHIQDV